MIRLGIGMAIFMTAIPVFAQGGPRGFYGCHGNDPNGWATEAGSGECVASNGPVLVPRGVYVDVDDPPCATGPNVFLENLNSALKAGVSYGLSEWLGPVAPIVAAKLGDEIARGLHGRIDPRASCQVISVKLPKGATGIRASFWAFWNEKWEEQAPGGRANWAKWEAPYMAETPSGPVVYAVFKNWSHNLDRWVTIHAIYTPADMSREARRKPGEMN